MEMTKLDFVRAIQGVLSDESKWCKGAAARNIHGMEVSPVLPVAVSFCVYGAGRHILGAKGGDVGSLDKAERPKWKPFWDVMVDIGQYDPYKVSTGNIGSYNDSHTYAEIMTRLKEVEAKYAQETLAVDAAGHSGENK